MEYVSNYNISMEILGDYDQKDLIDKIVKLFLDVTGDYDGINLKKTVISIGDYVDGYGGEVIVYGNGDGYYYPATLESPEEYDSGVPSEEEIEDDLSRAIKRKLNTSLENLDLEISIAVEDTTDDDYERAKDYEDQLAIDMYLERQRFGESHNMKYDKRKNCIIKESLNDVNITLNSLLNLIDGPNTEVSVWSMDRDGGEEEVYYGTVRSAYSELSDLMGHSVSTIQPEDNGLSILLTDEVYYVSNKY